MYTCNFGSSDYRCAFDTSSNGNKRHDFAGVESCVVGTIIAAIVGYLSIRILIRLVLRGKFYIFAFYCLQ
ncbi:MAG: undecaprenyl-diphosphate phosphatase [Nitrososphaera sp.]